MKVRIAVVWVLAALCVTPLVGQETGTDEGDTQCQERIETEEVRAVLVGTDEFVQTIDLLLPDWDSPFPLLIYEPTEIELVIEFGFYREEDGTLLVIECSREYR